MSLLLLPYSDLHILLKAVCMLLLATWFVVALMNNCYVCGCYMVGMAEWKKMVIHLYINKKAALGK